MEKLYVLLFYKFIDIENPEQFGKKHLEFCKSIDILGRVLVAKEGINGSVCGTREQIELYKKYLNSDPKFNGVVFKEDEGLSQAFTKMQVKIKKEIVTFGVHINPQKNTGEYIQAEELHKLYEENPEDFIILDTRNDYEFKVGKFKNAIHLNIKNFRDFPQALNKIENLKNKKIVTYCTGGIRCEKASAYMKEKGFKNVYQLKDGILTFGKKFPDTFWEGKCFVFDKRLVAPINSPDSEKNTITECETCGTPCDLYKNCRNVNCDRLVISCLKCQKKYIGCCSEECLSELQKQFLEKSLKKQGRKINLEVI
jgi:UPF0176 protein